MSESTDVAEVVKLIKMARTDKAAIEYLTAVLDAERLRGKVDAMRVIQKAMKERT